MILIFGGTTEGRHVVTVCEEAHKSFFYSTKGDSQDIALVHGTRITGAMDELALNKFCVANNIQLIVDAAHPFAEELHRTVANVSSQLKITVIRYERNYPEQDERLVWCNSYVDAINYLESHKINNLLALTGVNTINKLKPYWEHYSCWFRILDRPESRQIAERAKFPLNKIIYYHQGEDESILFEQLQPQAIITKESGESGGFNQKVDAAIKLGIPVLVVKRPPLSPDFISVHGDNGLRKAIEKYLPSFFELRTGYTTGTCATAATKAAFISLLTHEVQDKVSITLPNGEWIYIDINNTVFEDHKVTCSVIKDAGDDPDVTNGQEIHSAVRINTEHKGVRFLKGKGVGTITLPGLGINIGEPAINKTPRMMMKREVFKVMRHHEDKLPNGLKTGIDITISVPKGEELALRTFNPKLGITDGISIIGTSGIVKPFSSDAFIGSIRREMKVAKALGCDHIIINSGAKSEKYVKARYPSLSPQAFIHYGNFIGETIKIASEIGFSNLTMGIMIGKAVKLAEGSLDTHSKKVVMNKDFLCNIAFEAGCDDNTLQSIRDINLARQLWQIIPENNRHFFSLIIDKCHDVCSPLFTMGNITILLIGEDGTIFS